MTRSSRGVMAAALGVLVVVLVMIAIISWVAGGSQPLREIAQPVAVPELPQ